MEVSAVCRSFIEQASALRWRDAVVTLNGLTMYEMLRALKALDDTDIAAFKNALMSVRPAVNAARIEYALAVVQTKRMPAVVPAGLPPDQVADAQNFAGDPYSILEESVPKSRLPAINVGLTSPTKAFMLEVLGAPRENYSQNEQPITNLAIKRRIRTSRVGPLNVTGLDSAITSFQSVMAAIQKQQRLVYRVLKSDGMLVVRYVRGSTTHVSNHSWGTAVDLRIGKQADARGDNQVLFGLLLIAQSLTLRDGTGELVSRPKTGCILRLGKRSSGGGKLLRNAWISYVLLFISFIYVSYGHAQTFAADRRTFGARNCHVEAPAEWENVVQVTWIGLCSHGYADGLGVLRRTTQDSSTDLFSGRVEKGYLRSGVLNNGRGYEVGAWKAGSVTESNADQPGYRDALMAVYEEAAKAADATARYMVKHSNPKSARFYTHLAKSFRMQLDD